MSQQEGPRQHEGAALAPEELAAEGATELPDREAMSLIAGPGGAGPLPIVAPPFGTIDPGEFSGPGTAEPLATAPDTGTPT